MNNRSYSGKQKLIRACATIPTTKSPKHFPADAVLLKMSSGRPEGFPEPHTCHFERRVPVDTWLLFRSAGRPQGLPKPHVCPFDRLNFESCSYCGDKSRNVVDTFIR